MKKRNSACARGRLVICGAIFNRPARASSAPALPVILGVGLDDAPPATVQLRIVYETPAPDSRYFRRAELGRPCPGPPTAHRPRSPLRKPRDRCRATLARRQVPGL